MLQADKDEPLALATPLRTLDRRMGAISDDQSARATSFDLHVDQPPGVQRVATLALAHKVGVRSTAHGQTDVPVALSELPGRVKLSRGPGERIGATSAES